MATFLLYLKDMPNNLVVVFHAVCVHRILFSSGDLLVCNFNVAHQTNVAAPYIIYIFLC
jgi:hypothetical protein